MSRGKGGRPTKFSPGLGDAIIRLLADGVPRPEIAKRLGIGRRSLQDWLRRGWAGRFDREATFRRRVRVWATRPIPPPVEPLESRRRMETVMLDRVIDTATGEREHQDAKDTAKTFRADLLPFAGSVRGPAAPASAGVSSQQYRLGSIAIA